MRAQLMLALFVPALFIESLFQGRIASRENGPSRDADVGRWPVGARRDWLYTTSNSRW